MNDTVRAAGGVVVRDGAVALIYRPKYEDWTLPKGKLEPGESEEEAALREVEEETGLRCELGRELGFVTYADRHGSPKIVHYWEMRVTAGEFTPNREVSELRWLPLDEAPALLTHDRDREMLERLAAAD
jgi:8-oxo-dGTP diphosphatase